MFGAFHHHSPWPVHLMTAQVNHVKCVISRIVINILVPVEATAFLGAIAGFVVLLLVLALYLSRKWYYVVPSAASPAVFGGVCVPFAEANGKLATSHHNKRLGKFYSFLRNVDI